MPRRTNCRAPESLIREEIRPLRAFLKMCGKSLVENTYGTRVRAETGVGDVWVGWRAGSHLEAVIRVDVRTFELRCTLCTLSLVPFALMYMAAHTQTVSARDGYSCRSAFVVVAGGRACAL